MDGLTLVLVIVLVGFSAWLACGIVWCLFRFLVLEAASGKFLEQESKLQTIDFALRRAQAEHRELADRVRVLTPPPLPLKKRKRK